MLQKQFKYRNKKLVARRAGAVFEVQITETVLTKQDGRPSYRSRKEWMGSSVPIMAAHALNEFFSFISIGIDSTW